MPLPALLRRLRRRGAPTLTLRQHPDDRSKKGLFAEPIVVDSLRVLPTEALDDGQHRVSFLIEVRDADGRRCTDLAVEAHVTGPHRERTVHGTTDLMGRLKVRMSGPAGRYAIEVTDVAAHGLDWDREAGTTSVETTVD